MVDLAPILNRIMPSIRETVDSLKSDTIRWTTDPDGVRDDELDPDTLVLTPAGRVVIYNGPCSIAARNPSGQTTQSRVDEGGHDQWFGRLTVKLPLSDLDIPPGSEGEILASRNPWLVGRVVVCIGGTGATLKASSAFEVELRQGG